MLSQSTDQRQGTQFHPPMGAATRIALETARRKPAMRVESTPQRQVPPKKLYCKTCLGQCCIGRCRF